MAVAASTGVGVSVADKRVGVGVEVGVEVGNVPVVIATVGVSAGEGPLTTAGVMGVGKRAGLVTSPDTGVLETVTPVSESEDRLGSVDVDKGVEFGSEGEGGGLVTSPDTGAPEADVLVADSAGRFAADVGVMMGNTFMWLPCKVSSCPPILQANRLSSKMINGMRSC